MKTIAFVGGVGKTTLVYHLAHMLPRIGYPTVAVDLDPQANLTAAFFDEERLETLWEENGSETIMGCLSPILDGTGDIGRPTSLAIPESENLWLIAGNLGLSRFEDELSDSWPRGYEGKESALRTTSAFYRIIQVAANEVGAVVALVDVGPNLGAINRATLLAADYLVIPLAADLFSLQGLRNLGPTVRTWRNNWKTHVLDAHKPPFDLPKGAMTPAGYVVLQHAVRLDRPVKAFAKWIGRIPIEYRKSVLGIEETVLPQREQEEHELASLRNYRSLMPMAQEARKPMFDLTAADGALGGHGQLVELCKKEFQGLAERIAERCGLQKQF